MSNVISFTILQKRFKSKIACLFCAYQIHAKILVHAKRQMAQYVVDV